MSSNKNSSLVPKRLAHIWIGPRPRPKAWMQTWIEKHPDWDYTLYDNAFLQHEEFRTRRQIDEYMKRGDYAGVADLMRYEILFRTGGFIAAADSECLLPIDELLEDGGELYTVYENEFRCGKLVSPIMASVPGHPFLDLLISKLSKVPPECLDTPWRQTGNLFVAQMIEEHTPNVTVWPSHYLIPEHFDGLKYKGPGRIYANQKFGTTTGAYEKPSIIARLKGRIKRRYRQKRMRDFASARKRSGFEWP